MSDQSAEKAQVETRIYRREDGWEVVMRVRGATVVYIDHLPVITTPPPEPLTVEYVERACGAHGYERAVLPACAWLCDNHAEPYTCLNTGTTTPCDPCRSGNTPVSTPPATEVPCGSCGAPTTHRIILRGKPISACLRHTNVWRTPAADYTCPTRCVEVNHPGQEHHAWLTVRPGMDA